MLHPASTLNHKIENWSYADATARTAATGFVAADVGKLAWQASDGTYWRLTDDSPITWQQVTTVSAGGSDVVLLESHLAASSASLDFPTCFSSTYEDYEIHFAGIVSASAVTFQLEVTTNSGSSYAVTGYNSEAYVINFPTGAGGSNGSTTNIILTNQLYSTGGWSFNGRLRLYVPTSAALYKAFEGLFLGPYGSPTRARWQVNGWYESTTALTGFRVKMSSGNITSGRVTIFGFKH